MKTSAGPLALVGGGEWSEGCSFDAELLEREGVSPSVEFPRSQWVQVERWDVFRQAEWQSEMEAAHAIISAKLPKRTRDVLAMPVRERKRVIAERKALLAGRAPQKS